MQLNNCLIASAPGFSLELRAVGDKLWAVLSSLGLSEELGITECDVEIALTSAGTSEDELKALLELFGLSEEQAEAFIGQTVSLLNALGGNSTLEQQLQTILSALGVSDGDILGQVQPMLQQLGVSGSDLVADLQHLQALLADLGLPNGVRLARLQALLKSANISTAGVLAVVQHVQGVASDLNVFMANLKAATADLFGLAGVSDAGALGAFRKFVGFLSAQGVSIDDVKLGVATAVDFFQSLSITDVPALLADVHGLLVVAGVPHGSLQGAMYSFLNEAKALKTLIMS